MNQKKYLFENISELLYQSDQSTKPGNSTWLVRGLILAKLGRYEEAINSYYKALEIEPANLDILYLQGVALIALGKREEAIATFEKIIKIDPDYHKAWREVAYLGAVQNKVTL